MDIYVIGMCGFPARLAKTITALQGSLWPQFSTPQPITIVNGKSEHTVSQCPVNVVCVYRFMNQLFWFVNVKKKLLQYNKYVNATLKSNTFGRQAMFIQQQFYHDA